jgi:hypothetical protein
MPQLWVPHISFFEMWGITALAAPAQIVILSKAKDLQVLRIRTNPG